MNVSTAMMDEATTSTQSMAVPGQPAYADSKAIGFGNVVAGVVAKAQQASSLSALRKILVSLGGFQEETAMWESLLPHQSFLLEHGGNLQLGPAGEALADNEWVIGLWRHGHIYLSRALPPSGDCHVFGVARLPEGLAAKVAGLQDEGLREQDARMPQVEALISSCGAAHMIETARFALCYSEPSIFYVNEETFSNFGPINNLLTFDGTEPPGYLFVDLLHKPLREWTANQKVLVYCLYMIRRAGVRCEEFSGRQMNLLTLESWMQNRYEHFTRRVGVQPAADSPPAMADHLFALRQALKKDHFFYRTVNGINFNKTENIGKRSDVCLSVYKIPRRLRDYVQHRYEVRAERHASIDTYFRAVVEQMAAIDGADQREAALEGFIETLVRTATDELASDYGMTRAPRDFHAWARALRERRYLDICNWIPNDFFTAVYAGKSLDERLNGDQRTLHKMLYSVAGRMTFNSWHYAAGQCPVESVPADRHFLFPPRLSDLVIVSHQHHAGHRVAEVNMAIRSPAGIFINNKKYYGMIDLRFVRGAGKPYTYEELVRSRELTAHVRAFYQALADVCTEKDTAIPIQGYSKEWYSKKYLSG